MRSMNIYSRLCDLLDEGKNMEAVISFDDISSEYVIGDQVYNSAYTEALYTLRVTIPFFIDLKDFYALEEVMEVFVPDLLDIYEYTIDEARYENGTLVIEFHTPIIVGV